MIETTILDNIIIGRIDPHIYAFRTNTVPNYLKVGDTYRPVNVRIDEWRQLFPNLEHLEDWKWTAKTKNEKYFRDYAVHYYLENVKHLHRLQEDDIKGLPYYSREFFQNAKPKDIDEAIKDINLKAKQIGGPYQFYSEERLPVTEHFERNENYEPRPNQKETINAFIKARNNGRRNLLMYAVMRFGKSFTSMCCATEMNAKTVLIVSAKGDVRDEWKRTIETHVRFEDYEFVDSQDLLYNTHSISDLLQKNKRAAVFLTLQDLAGENIKDKHQDIFKNQIDLLIVDETHYGARAEVYGKILKEAKLNKTQIKKELSLIEDETFDKLEDGLKLVKELKVDTTLHLSGTPYRILMGSEFSKEDIIAFYQFTDIIDDKEKWDNDNLWDNDNPNNLKKEKDVKEWDNPYYGFPQMVRFAFNPNESSRRMLEELKKHGKTASLSELFRPKSISKDDAKKYCYFEHEKEVLDLLEIIDGSKEDENILGFLDYKKIKDGSMCRHIVCVLPYRSSCDAFETLLKNNKNKFKNLSQYNIVNIAGQNNKFKSPEQIKKCISDYEAHDKKSITLTVNHMLTGSTVREWDTMLFLKDVSSPQEYDQAIFRLQNQYVKTYIDEKNNSIVYNMKPQTLLVDFDPKRMFVMQEQKSKIYNVNTDKRGNEKLEERIKKELKFSPIIVINKGKLTEADPANVMDAVRKYSASRTIMDEARDIPIDYALLKDPNIQSFIEGLEPIDSQKGLNIKPIEGNGNEFQIGNDDKNISSENVDNNTDNSKKTAKKDDADKRLATYFAQILFFALLTDDKVDSLSDIIKVISNNENNARIANNTGLEKNTIKYLYNKLNPFILQELDYKIKNINELIRDTSIDSLDRVEFALRNFGRFSTSEIVTPSNVADDVVALLPEDGIDENTRFLDIASKQAEFACTIYRRYGNKVRNNIFSLPTSSLAYEFTRKVYSLLELPIKNIINSFNTYSLLDDNKDIYINTLKDMKFNVIVGNPPYQEETDNESENNGQRVRKNIFHYFQMYADKIANKSTALIYPARWIQRSGKGMADFGLEQINDRTLDKVYFYPDSKEVFNDVAISDGISIVIKKMDKTSNKFIYIYSKNEEKISVEIDAPGDKIIPLNPKDILIVIKIEDYVKKAGLTYLHDRIHPRSLFSIESNFVEKNKEAVRLLTSSSKIDYSSEIKLYSNDKAGKAGRATWFIAKKNIISKGIEYINKWKVVVSSANAGSQKRDNQIEIIDNHSVFGRSRVALASFDTKKEAENFYKYSTSYIIRFAFLMTDENLTTLGMKVPDIGDYTDENSLINFSKDIDIQLAEKIGLTKIELQYIKEKVDNLR